MRRELWGSGVRRGLLGGGDEGTVGRGMNGEG